MRNYFIDTLICEILRGIKVIISSFDNVAGVLKTKINIFVPRIKNSKINNYCGIKFSVLIRKSFLRC